MDIIGDYHSDGYAHVREIIPVEVARALLAEIKAAVGPAPIPLSRIDVHPNLLNRPAFEIYGHHYRPMLQFLWGLTPLVASLVGKRLLPTYNYFRIYREGDVCKVYSDRYSCEHSLSLTLDYSDGEPWALDIGAEPATPSARVEADFGPEPYRSVSMAVGDAVLYQGVARRHGRTTPNPNAWSAHLFLHWVDRDGPYRDHAFDGQAAPAPVNFSFA